MNSGVGNNNKNNNNAVVVAYEFQLYNTIVYILMEEGKFISLEEVEEAYFDCRKHKRYSRGALEYEMRYELNNYELWRDLNDMTYEIGVSIGFCVTRPKLREVFAAAFRDRVVHHIIMRKFLRLFEAQMIDDSYNCRVGKGVLYGVNRIRQQIETVSESYSKECWVLRCDLSGFFMSIDRDILWDCSTN